MAEIGLRRGSQTIPGRLPRLRKAKPLHIDHIFYRCAEPLRYQLLDSTGYGVQYSRPLPDRLHIPLLTGRQCIHDKTAETGQNGFCGSFDDAEEN
ncbi:MAG: hypothetical protein ACLRMJ_03625 [Alistipes finegoldii]